MENKNNKRNRINAILSGALTLTILASCANTGEDVIVTMKEKDKVEDVKPTIEVEEEATWVQYDESVLMYKVDLDRFLRDRIKLTTKTLNNSDVIDVIGIIYEELGEDLYTKDKQSTTLYNLEGRSVTIGYSGGYGRSLYVKFHDDETPLVYEVDVEKDGKTHSVSRSREYESLKFAKYYVIYSEKKEFTRSICFREDISEYLSIGLHEKGTLSKSACITFDSEMAKATINISDEEYAALHEIMLSYSESDNLFDFLSDNNELLNKYLDLICEKNAEYYEYLCRLINKYTEKAKVLRYE